MNIRKIILLGGLVCSLMLTAGCAADQEKNAGEDPAPATGQTDSTQPAAEPDKPDAGQEKDKAQEASGEPSKETDAAAPSDKPAAVGESINYHGVIVTVHGIRESKGDDYLKPKEGSVLKVLDITVDNQSDKEQVISSALSFSLSEADGKTHMPFITSDIKQPVEGKLAPGEKLRGEIPYEISKDAKDLKLTFVIPLMEGNAVWALE